MNNITDITSLKEFQEYREAVKNLKGYHRNIQQMERSIDKRYQSYKAKLKEAEQANDFKEEQDLKYEAKELKAEAETIQQQLDEVKEKSPHYGNLKGDAKRELTEKGRVFIQDLQDQAQRKIREARETLTAIHESKNKFATGEAEFIPSVTHKLEELKKIENTF